jgi:hypothetical protein
VLGFGIGQYLRWNGTVWLSNAGPFWPIVCAVASVAILVGLAVSKTKDRTARVWGWLLLTWTWLYLPLWLTADQIPQSSAVVPRDGRVYVAREWARLPSDKIWLLTRRGSDKIVRNVLGTAMVTAADVQYRFADSYIATRGNGDDLLLPVMAAAGSILAEEAAKPRSSRIALFEKPDVHDRLLTRLCRAIAPSVARCPLKLSVTPQAEAMIPGAIWSKVYTEQEAIDEKDVATLVQLLTQDNSRLVDRDRVFALFIALAGPEKLTAVAQKSSLLDAFQFDELIGRIVASPSCGNEAVTILAKVNRLTEGHRLALRSKVLREASLTAIAGNAAALRVSDADIAELAPRMRASSELTPEVAVLVLEKFGERLPLDAQQEAIASVVKANAKHALAAMKYVNFSGSWRQKLMEKIIADASNDDFETARLSRESLEDLLTPSEMRALIAVVIARSQASKEWLGFAVRALPVRAMTPAERKGLLNSLMFESTKSALEFVSENRHYFDAKDVDETTQDYSHTLAPDFCLHLSHRNKNRKTDYFSEAQLQIFRECAQLK